jgi:hypothetical protein
MGLKSITVRNEGNGIAESHTKVVLFGIIVVNLIAFCRLYDVESRPKHLPNDERDADHMDGDIDLVRVIGAIEGQLDISSIICTSRAPRQQQPTSGKHARIAGNSSTRSEQSLGNLCSTLTRFLTSKISGIVNRLLFGGRRESPRCEMSEQGFVGDISVGYWPFGPSCLGPQKRNSMYVTCLHSSFS